MTFDEAIVSGGDERIELKSNKLNKYLVNPLSSDGYLNRGSCTCSPISTDVKPKVLGTFNKYITDESTIEDIRIKQRFRIKALLQDQFTSDFNIFFAASGSDLCYYPLLFSKITKPEKPIMSLITCPEELGTGSLLAYGGKYFSEKTQIEPSVIKGEKITEQLNIDLEFFPARDENGNIIDHKQSIYKVIEDYKESHNIIVNLVIGSKSGIEDNISIIEDGPKNVTWVVDLCQMRATPNLFNKLLSLNCMLMITGSKFYQSPPFCGALLIPESIGSEIKSKEIEAPMVEGFTKIYSKYDIPPAYKKLRENFSATDNIGLTLRWEAALCESEILISYGEREITHAIFSWNKYVCDALAQSEYFEIITDQRKTNRSIISFKIKKSGKMLSINQLKEVYSELLLNSHLYQDKFKGISIGQPVEYENLCFLRFALGSRNIRNLIDSDLDFSNDQLIIDVLSQIVEKLNFD